MGRPRKETVGSKPATVKSKSGQTPSEALSVTTSNEITEASPASRSNCGWCYTGQHDDCHPTVDSQPKWKCDCYLAGHKKQESTTQKRKRK